MLLNSRSVLHGKKQIKCGKREETNTWKNKNLRSWFSISIHLHLGLSTKEKDKMTKSQFYTFSKSIYTSII